MACDLTAGPAVVTRDATAAALADEAYDVVTDDPRRSQALGREALRLARDTQDEAAQSAAHRALGMAALELDRASVAVTHLEAAVLYARRSGEGQREANARTSLALALVGLGAGRRALRHADAAVRLHEVPERGPVHLGRALVLERLGRLGEALEEYRVAITAFRRAGNRNCEARALCDRGVLQTYRGDLKAAEADLERAEGLCRELGLDLMAASVRQNLGFVAAQRGDVPAALARYDGVHETFARLGGTRYAVLENDRCELLLFAGLIPEARISADRAIRALAETGMGAELAEARLLRAEVALADQDWSTAGRMAKDAVSAFASQRRPNWTALARFAAVRSAWRADGGSELLLGRARGAARGLERHGWIARGAEAHLLAGEIALTTRRPVIARSELLAASRARRHGTALARMTGWYAQALLCETEGRPADARRAVARGLRLLDDHRAALGATELRSLAAGRAAELVDLGLRYALGGHRPAEVLVAAERGRARAGHLAPVRPPPDPGLAAALGELRSVTALTEQEARDRRPSARLVHRQSELERAISRRLRQLPGTDFHDRSARLSIGALREVLADRALVEYVGLGGRLHAVTLTRRSCQLTDLGAMVPVERELEHLHFALRRLAAPVGAGARTSALHRRNAVDAATQLQSLIFDALSPGIGDREIVIVPTGALHGLAWPALPALADCPLSIAPSAALWLRAAGLERTTQRPTLLVAGPGLPHAAQEAAQLAALYGDAMHLNGDAASVDAVAAAFESCDRAHLACHGSFRADNPLFSALSLADGPLTVHDLERLDAVPSQIILSSCDSGRALVRAGDELMGFASALLALGAGVIIASTLPVPDAQTKPLMIELHRRLEHGDRPAEALRSARTSLGAGDHAETVARCAFLCLGAG